MLTGKLESLPGLLSDMGASRVGTPEEELQGKNANGGFARAPSPCTAKDCGWVSHQMGNSFRSSPSPSITCYHTDRLITIYLSCGSPAPSEK